MLCLLGAVPAMAQTTPKAAATSDCVEARVGSAESYDCLNRVLQQQVPVQRPVGADLSLNAMSPAPAIGTYNQAAVREHLGNSFGHSAIPQRPPAPVFAPMPPR